MPRNENRTFKTKEELVEIAEAELGILFCIRSHFVHNPKLSEVHGKIRQSLLKSLEQTGLRYIMDWNNPLIPPRISYLNIDATLESTLTLTTLYLEPDALYRKLEQAGHQVIREELVGGVETAEEVLEEEQSIKVDEFIDKLLQIEGRFGLHIFKQHTRELTPIQRKILSIFEEHSPYLEMRQFLEVIREPAKKRDSRVLQLRLTSALFYSLPDTDLFKSRLLVYFPVGAIMTGAEMMERWNNLFTESHLSHQITREITAIKFTKAVLKCRKLRRQGEKSFEIQGLNPYQFVLIRPRPRMTTKAVHLADMQGIGYLIS